MSIFTALVEEAPLANFVDLVTPSIPNLHFVVAFALLAIIVEIGLDGIGALRGLSVIFGQDGIVLYILQRLEQQRTALDLGEGIASRTAFQQGPIILTHFAHRQLEDAPQTHLLADVELGDHSAVVANANQLLANEEPVAWSRLHTKEDAVGFPFFGKIIILSKHGAAIDYTPLPILVELEDIRGVVVTKMLNVIFVVVGHHVGTRSHAQVVNALQLLCLKHIEAQQ